MDYLELLTDENVMRFLLTLRIDRNHKVEILSGLETTDEGKQIIYKVTDTISKEESTITGVFKNFQYDIKDQDNNSYTYYIKWYNFMVWDLIVGQKDPRFNIDQYWSDYNNYHKNEMQSKIQSNGKETETKNFYDDYILM